jgi:hypothetical protein
MPVVILGLGWGRLAAEKKPLENRKTNPAATPGGDYSPDLSIPMVLVRQIGSQVENKSLDHSSGAFAGSVGFRSRGPSQRNRAATSQGPNYFVNSYGRAARSLERPARMP